MDTEIKSKHLKDLIEMREKTHLLSEELFKLTGEVLSLQEAKINLLFDFLEHEEAYT
jgi:hypothetical protein